MELVVRLVLELLFHCVFFNTARFLLPIVTLGKVRSKSLEKIKFWDFPMLERKQGVFYLGFDLSVLFGFLIWFSLALFIFGFLH